MSTSASIGLRVVAVDSRVITSPWKIIDILSKNGWTFTSEAGYVSYLPIGDNEMFNWTDSKMSLSDLMEILEKKEKNKELIGIRMVWKGSEVGGDLLIWDKDEARNKKIHTPISFILDGNRKILAKYDDFSITDINWYLEKLIPAFNQGDTLVEYYTYDEHI